MPFEPIVFSDAELQREDTKAKELIQNLELETQDAKNKNIKKIENTVFGTDTKIISWRFNEWDYYSKKIKLPTYARGLFTNIDGEIICRGYDKFFNLNEMASVKEDELRSTTHGPYTLTVKSNGCIVFISALKNGKLIVCSKHSTGERSDLSKNHAMVAQQALEAQLNKNNSNPQKLAELLYKYKITAVCEYCDDEFEEHVLEYKANKAGLYLHGLNFNTVDFKTYPIEKVQEFGKLFGFKETKYIKLTTFDEALEFMENSNKIGTFDNEEIEGFVIRCFKETSQDFFFKFKFEEPYLLYRELREVTKQFIHNGPTNLKFGKHKLICMDYIKFVMPYLVSDENLKLAYLENKGIIELRKKYFESKNSSSMQMINEELKMIDLEDQMKRLKFGESKSNRYVLVTVATIGCGKTTTSVGLSYLYPELIDHLQNDNIQTPGKDKLVVAALDALHNKPIVILDKNNHKSAERKQIFDAFKKLNEDIPKSKLKFICLNFIHNVPKTDKNLWSITRERVIQRGDDHQSIKVNKNGVDNAEKIMRGFISRFQLINKNTEPDCNFDYVINLDVHQTDSSLQNMKLIVKSLRQIITDIDLKQPTDDDFIKAFEKAKLYKPTFTKKMTPMKRKPSYFGISINDQKFLPFIESAKIDFYEKLKSHSRVQADFHITLMHSSMRRESNEKRNLWDLYTQKFKSEVAPYADMTVEIPESKKCLFSLDYNAEIQLERIVWNTKVMCVEVKILQFYHKNESIVLPIGNKYAHITIGTIDKSFPPVLAGKMLEKLHDGKEEDLKEISVYELTDKKILKNLPLYAFMM
jgi:tRNA ligase